MITDFLDSLPTQVLDRSRNLELNIRSVNAHAAIDELLLRTVLKGGKRLRPLLTYLVANLFKVDLDSITPFARAVELVHAASLSHDDVIDNATTRRGSPSINILGSNKRAVLAGDYLLSSAIVDLSSTGNLQLVKEMSLVINDLSVGEWLQLDLIASREYSRELIREIALKKTSSVMSYCTVAPAIFANMPVEIEELSRQFGINLGLAFQLIDDTLDYSLGSKKDHELDVKNGTVNSVVFEFLVNHFDLMKRFKAGEDLISLIDSEGIRPFVLKITTEAHGYLEKAQVDLEKIGEYLKKTLYLIKDDDEGDDQSEASNLRANIDQLQMVISFMALRQN
jgi:octaprenyl-diphosphate synthase